MLKPAIVTQPTGELALDAAEPPSRAGSETAARLMLVIVGLAPVLHAVSTANPWGADRPLQNAALVYSLPVTVIEIAVVALALLSGFRVAGALDALSAWQKAALSVLVIVAAGTSAVAENGGHSAVRAYQLLVHLLFGFSAWHLFQTRWASLRTKVWPWVVAGAGLYALAVIPWVMAVQNLPHFNWERFSFGVINIRQTGFYTAVGVSAALGLAAVADTKKRYWLAVAGATLLFALNFWSGTRGSLIAIAAALAAGWVLVPNLRTARGVMALVVAAAAGALVSIALAPPTILYGLARILGNSATMVPDALASGRVGMWDAALRAVLERPLFGYGESQFGVAAPAWKAYNHPHNIFLQILVQWGIVGFACYFALAAALAWKMLKAARQGGPELVAPFLVAAALVTMSLYEGSLYHPHPYMIIALSAAFILAARPVSAAAGPPEARRREA